jgi:hypothetical protein
MGLPANLGMRKGAETKLPAVGATQRCSRAAARPNPTRRWLIGWQGSPRSASITIRHLGEGHLLAGRRDEAVRPCSACWRSRTGGAEQAAQQVIRVPAWVSPKHCVGAGPGRGADPARAASPGPVHHVVALARQLAGILYAMLRDGTTYRPPRVRSTRGTAAVAA